MLAQSFKSHTDLGISDVELGALIKVLGMLEREEIPFAPVSDRPAPAGLKAIPTHFNMILVKSKVLCGTAACICGWAREMAGDDVFNRPMSRSLSALFYMGDGPFDIPCKIEEIKPSHAATALRSYLTTGEASWAEALAA